MKRIIYLSCFLIVCLVACKPLAYKKYVEGKKQTENLNYSVGIEKFLESWNKSPEPETARGLAQAYSKMRNFEQAEEWYTRLERDGELEESDLRPYAESLIANSKYSEATAVLAELDSTHTNPELNLIWKTALGGKSFLNKSSESAILPVSEANSPFSEFGPMISDDTVLHFTSDRLLPKNVRVDPNNALKSDIYGWTGNGFLKMYEAGWNTKENTVKEAPVQTEMLNGNLHVGPLYKKGENLFLTFTQVQKHKKSDTGSSRDYTLFPELFFALDTGNVTLDSFMPLPFNAPFSYSVSDPFYDSSSSRLYFSSDMPGGSGQADLYYSEWREGAWSAPVNLGEVINTTGDERTPYIDKNGILYFSSTGHAGLGGLDIFRVHFENGKYTEPENLGSPINSNRDDFGLSLLPGSDSEAVFSSDRKGGKGLDDIYFADLFVQRDLVIKGDVIDKETGEKLEDGVVTLYNAQNQLVNTYVSEADGSFRFKVKFDQIVHLEGKKTGYLTGNSGDILIPTAAQIQDSVLIHNIYLDKIAVGKTYTLENIYYDFDKWNIREDAKPELNNLIKILKDNPTIKIELYSHTDSRGTNAYNLKLSDRRAKSVVAYLIESGIDQSRLKAIGYGEEKLLNSCSDNVSCTEVQHQENRRTEFKITEY
ncbi:outer membrane protein OmpA-like peptidoglycan-associated protein [Algoriphagus sp. 4150]|uniref:OmpA family protein n=1 Tax=Algoriphagus sp. 4150 TaxID=2817756 RepID=UPI002862BB82|nr:OmpA family protein [Algoriphagus sp. 4150]MDR7129523.1 outer membrane protein OmpA-like peptidoglycan-associated protein [Algoriphagus sp. 4150]